MASTSFSNLVLQTTVLVTIRASLFFACHRYLLHALFRDLQALTLANNENEISDEEYELVNSNPDGLELPLPNAAPSSTTDTISSIFHGRALHSIIARYTFSLCFSETSILFFLVMFQTLDVFSERTRQFNWDISMTIILMMILLCIPLTEIFILTRQLSNGRSMFLTTIFAVILYFFYLFILLKVPIPHSETLNLRSSLFSRLIVVGIVILGLLSGFGAVSNAWDFFPSLSRTKREEPFDQDVIFAEQSLIRVRNDLFTRRNELERRLGVVPQNSSWFSTIVPKFRVNSEMSSLQQEISGLEALEYQMSRNLESLIQQRSQAVFSKTFRGRVLNLIGRIFAVYCVFRMLSSLINIFSPLRAKDAAFTEPVSYPDMITHLLTYMISLLPMMHMTDDEISAISRQISLILIGVIILSNMRLILRRVSRILSLTSRNLGAFLLLLILAQLMCTYLLSSLVQLRTVFPPPPVRSDVEPMSQNLFITLPEYEVFGTLFDGFFLFSAFLSIVFRWVDVRLNGV